MPNQNNTASRQQLARILRDAAPYLLAHRERKVVVCLPSELVAHEQLAAWLGDVALLREVVGMRFALTFDALHQATALGAQRSPVLTGFTSGEIPVSPAHLEVLGEAATSVRSLLETSLALAAPSGLRGVSAISGNPLAARSAGIVDGTDLGHMGVPKRIEPADVTNLLDTGKVVLVPPVGSSHAGAQLHLDAAAIALTFATACSADKLVFILPPQLADQLEFRELSLAETRALLADNSVAPAVGRLLEIGCQALDAGIERIHFLNMTQTGSLLLEFLLPDGIATMLSKDRFDAVRSATESDVAAIAELIAPGVRNGALRPRSLAQLRDNFADFAVVARDEALVACASLEVSATTAEFGCLAVREEYSNQAYGQLLLDYFITIASKQGVETLVAVSTQATDWFTERDFIPAAAELLPPERLAEVQQRQGRVLARKIT